MTTYCTGIMFDIAYCVGVFDAGLHDVWHVVESSASKYFDPCTKILATTVLRFSITSLYFSHRVSDEC